MLLHSQKTLQKLCKLKNTELSGLVDVRIVWSYEQEERVLAFCSEWYVKGGQWRCVEIPDVTWRDVTFHSLPLHAHSTTWVKTSTLLFCLYQIQKHWKSKKECVLVSFVTKKKCLFLRRWVLILISMKFQQVLWYLLIS